MKLPPAPLEIAQGFCYLLMPFGGEQGEIMAKICEICGKGTTFGRNVSHAHNVTSRTWEPNLQRVRAKVEGGVRHIRVCTRCLRSGKVVKAPARKWTPPEAGAAK
jgi:large subunit ribosomal protein L28